MPYVDYEAWNIFASVARLGSFTAAADYHKLSKPTISKAITRLEEQIGTALFHRSSRKLSLSASGKKLLPYAQKISDDGQIAMEAASDESDILKGSIKMTAPLSFGLATLGDIIARFIHQYPDIFIDLQLSDDQMDLIENEYDLALRIGALKDSSLLASKIRTIQTYFIASPDYLEKYGKPKIPNELAQHDCILYSNRDNFNRWIMVHKNNQNQVIVEPKNKFQCNNGDMILPAIMAGNGIGYLPDFICKDHIENGQLVPLFDDWAMEELAAYIITPPSRHRPKRLQVLIEYLKKYLAKP